MTLTAEARKKAQESRRAEVELPDDPRLRRQAESVPSLHRKLYVRSVVGKLGLRARVKAKCLDCCAWQRSEVAACTACGCPLWLERPYK